MKRRIRVACFLMTLALLLAGNASANSWGLKGRLLSAVESAKSWDAYSLLGNQSGDFAVLGSRYHSALFYVDAAERLHVYTTAVYQPDDKRNAPRLTASGDQLTLWYGTKEHYSFSAWENDYRLTEAVIGDFSLTGADCGGSWQYRAQENGQTAVLPQEILLSNFNIALFPRFIGEVRHLNYMRARFDSGLYCLGTEKYTGKAYDADRRGTPIATGRKGNAPVYAAPYGRSSWRAAKGKAAVGLGGEIWLLSQYLNETGESYACIRYDVSERTQRIGYALCGDLGLPEIKEQDHALPGGAFVHVDVEAIADTYLTDDPDVSQFRQFAVPKGTQFGCMGLYNDNYAYVSAEVKGGAFTDGGAMVWGFVPIRDLKPMETERQPDVMAQLAGDWIFYAGGNLAPDILRFRADGTFDAGSGEMEEDEALVTEGALSGVWYVTKYSPFMNLYWNDPPYELTLLFDNGSASVHGLTMDETGFSLTYWEGGGGYVPLDGGAPETDGDANG